MLYKRIASVSPLVQYCTARVVPVERYLRGTVLTQLHLVCGCCTVQNACTTDKLTKEAEASVNHPRTCCAWTGSETNISLFCCDICTIMRHLSFAPCSARLWDQLQKTIHSCLQKQHLLLLNSMSVCVGYVSNHNTERGQVFTSTSSFHNVLHQGRTRTRAQVPTNFQGESCCSCALYGTLLLIGYTRHHHMITRQQPTMSCYVLQSEFL